MAVGLSVLLAAGMVAAGATPVAAIDAGPDNSHDFGSQRVGTTSAEEPVSVPFVVGFEDFDPAGVVYNGSDALVDFALSQLGLSKPVTFGALETKYPNATISYKLTSITLDDGTDFSVDADGCTGPSATSCSATLTFSPSAKGTRTDVLRIAAEDYVITDTSLVGQLAAFFAGTTPVDDGVEAYLLVNLSGTGTIPQVTSRFPTGGATGVPRDVRPNAVLTPTIKADTISASSVTLRDLTADAPVAVTVTWSATASKVFLRPATLLAPGHTYRVRLDSSITDTNLIQFDTTDWDFVVSADGVAPTVAGRKPASGATGVSRTANVVVTFSEPLRLSTVTKKTVRLRDRTTGAIVSAVVTVGTGGQKVTLNPSVTLAAKRSYTVLLSGTIRDVAGNPLTAASWSFTTGS